MKNYTLLDFIDVLDRECNQHKLPSLARIITGVPGRRDATPAEVDEVWKAAAAGKYDVLDDFTKTWFGKLVARNL